VNRAGPRNVQRLDPARLLFSTGGALHVLCGDDSVQQIEAASRSEVVAILPSRDRCFVVHQDGTVAALDGESLRVIESQRRSASICAAAALPWMDEARLLLVTESGPIECVGFDDSLTTQYLSTHRGLRVITASAGFVAAVSSDRQRAILWSSWDGRAPIAEVHITAQVRHRIADMEFC
jgi:hypothetical protein